ncbi:HD domain-containing protein, partial [Candidatus Saccharibacteria bacterium]|nr:HD domain-containing protein [Candidatus Saccharibacteria bacterium]
TQMNLTTPSDEQTLRSSLCSLVIAARSEAVSAHFGQKRKYTGQPYIIHCASVAAMVEFAGLPEEAVCAAWLHDTVEDTETTIENIESKFGYEVSRIVKYCTQVSTKSDGNRATRKSLDIANYQKGCTLSQSIKVADMLDNVPSIVAFDPDFGKVYVKEKSELLD